VIPFIAPTSGLCYVNHVYDGDTLKCDSLKVRLCGIDAPERTQPFGAASTGKLRELTAKKNVRIVMRSLDAFGRIIGEVYIGDRLINAEIVRAGLAYKYGSCPTDKRTIFVSAENSAIAGKVGVWQSEQIKPWDWRKKVIIKK